jgi:hypothetical protein
MASQCLSADFGGLVSRNTSYERLAFALRLHCGRGRLYSVDDLAIGTGVPSRAIECAMHPYGRAEFRPLRLEYLLSICKFLGAPFASALLEPAGLGTFELMDEQPPLPRVLNADSAKPAETPREKVERLQQELFKAVEEMTK